MQKQRINKQKVFAAAKGIAHLNKEPTTTNVRAYLAFTGSQTTLHKYLKEWRMKCFQAYDPTSVREVVSQEVSKLQIENQALVETMAKMEEQKRLVAHEFAKTERKNVELTQKVIQLETEINLLKKELNALRKDKEHADSLYHELKAEREVLLSRIEKDKDYLIDSLREELHQAHQINLQKIQDISYQGHELLMQEKVKALNLEEKVKSLLGDITRLQQELDRANQIAGPFKDKIKQLERVIAENLTTEQLREYAKKCQEQELRSN
jgi:hypothetical protein